MYMQIIDAIRTLRTYPEKNELELRYIDLGYNDQILVCIMLYLMIWSIVKVCISEWIRTLNLIKYDSSRVGLEYGYN